MTEAGSLVELRLLEGPNRHFPRATVELVLDLGVLQSLPPDAAQEFAAGLGLSGARPGPAGTAFRRHFTARAIGHLVRRLAKDGGVARLAVRSLPGSDAGKLLVAFPWRHSGRAEALANGIAAVVDAADGGATVVEQTIESAGVTLAAAPRGRSPRPNRPKIPVVAVAGGHVRTTTSLMVSHIARLADVQVEVAATASRDIVGHGLEMGHNTVSVVTDVSADELVVNGVDSLDQLATAMAVVTEITKRQGWCVLNADDPRTCAMRWSTKAQVWVFTRDPDSPTVYAVLDEGGRATTLLDGWVCVLSAEADPWPTVRMGEVPSTPDTDVTVESVLAATSAALALGCSVEDVSSGLRSFGGRAAPS